MYLGQDAEDGLHNPTTATALKKIINLQHNLLKSYMKLVIEFVDVNGLEQH